MDSEARGARSLGGVVFPVLAGALLLLLTLALQTGGRIQDERVERVIHYARSLGAVSAETVGRPGGGKRALSDAAKTLTEGAPEILAYAVVKEEGAGGGSGDGGGLGGLLGGDSGDSGGSALDSLFASLEGKEILAHSDGSLVGKSLSSEAGETEEALPQAQLFREANALKDRQAKNAEARVESPELTSNPYREVFVDLREDDSVMVVVPVMRDGKMAASVAVLAKPERVPPVGAMHWIILSALVILALGYGLYRASVPGLPVLGLLFVVPVLILSSQAYDGLTQSVADSHQGAAKIALSVMEGAGVQGDVLASLNRDAFGEPRALFAQEKGQPTVNHSSLVTSGFKRWWPPLVSGLAIIALAALFWTGRAQHAYETFVKHWFAYAYIAPTMVGMVVLVFGPFAYGLGLSFFARIYGDFHFVGLRNFVEILGSISLGSGFYTTFGVTVMWTVVNVFLHVSIGLGLALLLKDKSLGGTAVYRALLIVPWAVPNYITALIWKGLFNKEFGAINAFLGVFGVEPISWFDTFWKAFFANVATNTWLGFPFMMVVSLGALQSIPPDLYEAADVDGADRWAKFRFITLPLLKPALFPAVILGIIWTFNMFNVIYLVSGGAPDGQTDILITEAYRWAFERGRYGYAAAYSAIIFVILLGYTLITNKMTRATEGAYE